MVIPRGLVIGFLGGLLLVKGSYPRRKEIRYLAGTYFDYNPTLIKNLIINRWSAVVGSIWLSTGFFLQLFDYNLHLHSILKPAALFGLITGFFVISWISPSYMVRYQYYPPLIDETIKNMKSNRLLLLNNGLEPDEKSKGEEISDKQRTERMERAKQRIDGLGRSLLMKRKKSERYPDYCQRLISRLEKNRKRYR